MKAVKPSDNIKASTYAPARDFIRSIGVSQWRVTKYLEIAENLLPQGLTITDANIAHAVDSNWTKAKGKIAMTPLVEAGLFTVMPQLTTLGQQYAFTPKGHDALADLHRLKDEYDAMIEAKKQKPVAKVEAVIPSPAKQQKPSVATPVAPLSVADENQELRKLVEQLVITVDKQSVSMDAMAKELFRLGKLWS